MGMDQVKGHAKRGSVIMGATSILLFLVAIWLVFNVKSIVAIMTGQAKLQMGSGTTAS